MAGCSNWKHGHPAIPTGCEDYKVCQANIFMCAVWLITSHWPAGEKSQQQCIGKIPHCVEYLVRNSRFLKFNQNRGCWPLNLRMIFQKKKINAVLCMCRTLYNSNDWCYIVFLKIAIIYLFKCWPEWEMPRNGQTFNIYRLYLAVSTALGLVNWTTHYFI